MSNSSVFCMQNLSLKVLMIGITKLYYGKIAHYSKSILVKILKWFHTLPFQTIQLLLFEYKTRFDYFSKRVTITILVNRLYFYHNINISINTFINEWGFWHSRMLETIRDDSDYFLNKILWNYKTIWRRIKSYIADNLRIRIKQVNIEKSF